MKKILFILTMLAASVVSAQSTYYDVTAGDGYGVRFWNGSNLYKIAMGSGSEYRYGPVSSYSIKMMMSDNSDRGWTWGVSGQTPIAALSTEGELQIADEMRIGSITDAKMGTHKLGVNGSIICDELRVKLYTNWPDYVFGSKHNLMPLEELDMYIREHNHLPGIPAAAEVEAEGIAVGDMMTLQMEKIEELTLYIIQLENRLKQLEEQTKK